MHSDKNVERFKSKLLEEKKHLEGELSRLARVNPDNPKDLETTYGEPSEPAAESGAKEADPADAGERIEDYETRNAIEVQLESRLNEVDGALLRITSGVYGTCESSNGKEHDIEISRLEANPAARTCTAHM
ncbi:MAG: hypothetical protein HYS59_02100 [Candidatus Vogelbacteria bacterium]|nr:hypothetical protein [Candidatus Vogelbacteria bacterium]